jgi:FkbM family methyltransferase
VGTAEKKIDLGTYADFAGRSIRQPKVPPRFEQALVRKFFEFKSQGFFVDVGANDPLIDSQTFHLEQLGWRGLLIEPLPSYCEQLRAHRASQVIQCACSSPENHGKALPIHVAGVHSSLEPDLIAVGARSEAVIEVPVRTLDSILTEYGVEPEFDLLSIDVEGHEMEVFKGLDLRAWRPRLVLLEDHVTGHHKHLHMRAQGYQLLLRTGLNSWYVPEAIQYHFSLKARLEFFRKYWLGLLIRKIRYAR